MVAFAVKFIQGRIKSATNGRKSRSQSIQRVGIKDFAAVFWHKDQMDVEPKNNVSTVPKFVLHRIKPIFIMDEWYAPTTTESRILALRRS